MTYNVQPRSSGRFSWILSAVILAAVRPGNLRVLVVLVHQPLDVCVGLSYVMFIMFLLDSSRKTCDPLFGCYIVKYYAARHRECGF